MPATAPNRKRTQFRVNLEGIALTAAQETAIREEIQKVVMAHLAAIDFGGDKSAIILPLGPHGPLQGIVARLATPQELKSLTAGLE